MDTHFLFMCGKWNVWGNVKLTAPFYIDKHLKMKEQESGYYRVTKKDFSRYGKYVIIRYNRLSCQNNRRRNILL